MTWRQISTELRRVHAVELTGPAGSLIQTTPLNDEQSAILSACGVAKPPRMGALHPSWSDALVAGAQGESCGGDG